MNNQIYGHYGPTILPEGKVWFKTFGCQMNYHDTERLLYHLRRLNIEQTDDINQADLIIFNTCAIRQLANSKFYSQLGEAKIIKQKNPKLRIGVCGCVAQIEGKELMKKYPALDFVLGTDELDSIDEVILRLFQGESNICMIKWSDNPDYSIQTRIVSGSPSAFVNIIKGCNNFCSYCIVPYTRGREISRKLSEIVLDVRRLVKTKGIQEVTLLGQNVNSFGKEHGESLPQLIYELDKIGGLEIIRYITGHPYDLSDDLINVYKESKKLSKHLHLPVQSGSNTVLKRMNRRYTREHYLGLLDKLREVRPDIVISSDIIVGFPNETEAEFQDTLDLLTQAQFDFVYSFNFSPRPGTQAAKIKDCLDLQIKKERLKRLQEHQLVIQEKIRAELVGKKVKILVEGQSFMKGIAKWKGRTDCFRIVHFKDVDSRKNYKWHWVDVEILSSTALSCQGKLLKDYGKCPNS